MILPLFTAQAQNPFAEPKNLQVLPETIKGDQLRQIMRNFSFATGERCTYSHLRQYLLPAGYQSLKAHLRRALPAQALRYLLRYLHM
jgi:hypothetical protein